MRSTRSVSLSVSRPGVAALSLALLASALAPTLAPALAKIVLTPGSRPTTIVPGRPPFTFAHPPVLRTAFARDEPFLEGELRYGYTGRVTTPVMRGSDMVVPAGSAAYGIPMRSSAGGEELVWCAPTHRDGKARMGAVCLFDEGLGFGGYDSLMTTAAYILDHDAYGGGEIVPAPFDLGAPVKVRYYVQNLGKIARVKGQIWVGDTMVNQWGYQWGDIARSTQPAERLFAVGGGVIGIMPDPAAKDHYVLRVLKPLTPDGGPPMSEVRNDARAVARAVERAKVESGATP